MARAIWSGAISFGLVNVPVKLYSATSPKSVRFHQLSKQTGARIRQQRIDESTGEPVEYGDIVKGYELAPEQYVVIDPDELEALDPEVTHTIEIESFVELEQIDPIYYDSTYFVAPGGAANKGATKAGTKAYHLLLEAMEASGRVGIGRVVLRSKQQLCALRPLNGVLALSTMLYGDEVNRPEGIDDLQGVADADATSAQELKMAGALINGLSGDFDPTEYRDEYRDRVLALIERKAAGQPLTAAPGAAQSTPTAAPDLMAALEASLAAVKSASKPKPKPKAKRTRASDDTKTADTKTATAGDEKPKRSRTTSRAKAE
jgi:DNA end-binding protein Ku